jgi:single-strand DNA-binding protein
VKVKQRLYLKFNNVNLISEGRKTMSFAKVTIVGYLGRDPELRYTPDGTAVCNFSVATTERRKNSAGEMEENTLWFKVATWGRQAEVAAEYLAKGRQVYVEGRLRTSEYTDREGMKRFSLDLSASDVHFLGQRGDGASGTEERSDEFTQADEHVDMGKTAKPASAKSGRKSGGKRGSSKEKEEFVGIGDNEIPF